MNDTAPTGSALIDVPTCPLCGGPYARVLDGVPDVRGLRHAGRWRYLSCGCAGCRTLWLSPRPRDLASLYEHYFTHDAPSPPNDSLAKRLVFSWTRFARRKNFFFAPTRAWGSRVLEVGCGNGTNLARLAAAGWRVAGQDFDSEAVARARSLGVALPTDLFAGPLEEMPAAEPFDAVLLSHVLEHVTDPGALLRACRDRLRPGGRLVVITPNPRALGLRIFGRLWPSLHAPFHVVFLQPCTLARLAGEAGFLVEESLSDDSVSGPAVGEALARRFGPVVSRLLKNPLLFVLQAANRFAGSGGDESILVARREG